MRHCIVLASLLAFIAGCGDDGQRAIPDGATFLEAAVEPPPRDVGR